jgi:hypothetical protein
MFKSAESKTDFSRPQRDEGKKIRSSKFEIRNKFKLSKFKIQNKADMDKL